MNILYKNKFAEKQFCSRYKKKWKYPEQVRKKLEAAENYMINADSLMDVANYLPFHFERLRGDRKDEWSNPVMRMRTRYWKAIFSRIVK